MSDEIPQKFDTSRTYYYYTNHVKPDSLLAALHAAGFVVTKAWYCEEYYYWCMDTVGPHFTVELAFADPRILQYQFTKGVGKVTCAKQLNLFMPVD